MKPKEYINIPRLSKIFSLRAGRFLKEKHEEVNIILSEKKTVPTCRIYKESSVKQITNKKALSKTKKQGFVKDDYVSINNDILDRFNNAKYLEYSQMVKIKELEDKIKAILPTEQLKKIEDKELVEEVYKLLGEPALQLQREFISKYSNIYRYEECKNLKSLLTYNDFVKLLRRSVSKDFYLDNYFESSTDSEASAAISSNNELNKLYIKQCDEKINYITKQIEDKKELLEILLKARDNCREIQKSLKEKKPLPKIYKNIRIKNKFDETENLYMVKKNRKGKAETYTPYVYEMRVLNPLIRRIRSNIGNLTFKLNKKTELKKFLEEHIIVSTFGSKALLKKQYTANKYKHEVCKDIHKKRHNLWKNEFSSKRKSSMSIQGKSISAQGNPSFRYDDKYKTLTLKVPCRGENGDIIEKTVVFENVIFKYRKDEILTALSLKGYDRKPIQWTLTDYGDYYIVYVTYTPQKLKDRLYANWSVSTGITAYDINYGHIDYAVLNQYGYPIYHDTLMYDVNNNSSIRSALERVFKTADDFHTVIAKEKIDSKSIKSINPYNNKKANRKISELATAQFEEAAKSLSYEYEILVVEVEPAYTSMLSKIKFVREFGISIHVGAAIAIGRRAMGKRERLPKMFNKFVTGTKFNRFKQAYSIINGIKNDVFLNKNIDYINSLDMLSVSELKKLLRTIEFYQYNKDVDLRQMLENIHKGYVNRDIKKKEKLKAKELKEAEKNKANTENLKNSAIQMEMKLDVI